MRIARGTVLALLVAMFGIAPAWAQDTQQTPPPVPPMMAGSDVICRTGGPGEGRVMIWRERGMEGSGDQFFERFREGGAPFGMDSEMGSAFASRVNVMVNDARIRQRLGITDAQAAKIRQQTTDFQISRIRSRADVQVDELQLRNLIVAQNPDRAAIDQKLDDISAAQLADRKKHVDYLLALRDDLTPEQRQELRQMREAPLRGGWRGQSAPPASSPSPAQPKP